MSRQGNVPPRATDKEIDRAVNIEPTAIQEEYSALPGDLHYWAAQVSDRNEVLDNLEDDLRAFEARTELHIITEATKAGVKPPPEAVRQAQVRVDPFWKLTVRAISKARRDKADAQAVLDAIKAKKEMLISLGATQRLELEREALIRDRQRRD